MKTTSKELSETIKIKKTINTNTIDLLNVVKNKKRVAYETSDKNRRHP